MNPATDIPAQPQQPDVMLGTFPYGWDGVVATQLAFKKYKNGHDSREADYDIHGKRLVEQLPFPRVYRKAYTHPPGTIVVGAPKRGGFWEKFELKEPEGYDDMPEDAQKAARRHYRRCLVRKNQCKPVRYIVWGDRSLRRTDNVLRKQFAGMTKEQQENLMAEAAKGVSR